MTTKELAKIEARYQRASRRYEAERAIRNNAIRIAIAKGMKPADVARATGLTRGRIAQIAPCRGPSKRPS